MTKMNIYINRCISTMNNCINMKNCLFYICYILIRYLKIYLCNINIVGDIHIYVCDMSYMNVLSNNDQDEYIYK